jgi:two-component sensor histidine kinase/DNA-binding response OmpR family regulator
MDQKTLLLVEDDPFISLSEKISLEKYGYSVLIANSGERSIEIVNQTPGIHLILMDIDLGSGIDGTVAAEIILKNHQIPIVFLSSHTEPEIVEKTERITSYGYVVKNSNITVLDASIKMAFKLFETQSALAKTSQLLEYTGELAKVGGWQVDLNTMKLSWTLQTFKIADIEPPNEPPLEEGINLFAPQARPIISEAIQIAIETGKPYDLQLPIITSKGRKAWVQTQGFVETREGKAIRLYGTFQDITERRMTEIEIEKERRNNEIIINSTNDLMWSLDLDYKLIKANSTFVNGFLKTTGVLLKSGDSLLMRDLFPDEYLAYWKGFYDRAIAGEDVVTEIAIPTENVGASELWQMKFNPFYTDEHIIGVCCYGRNITESKQAEEKINLLLREKEIILKEVHHRIKNNMVMISALLKMQASSLKEKPVVEALLDAERRIQSMILLYDKLYQSQDFSKTSFKEYLSRLVDDIIYNLYNSNEVEVIKKIDDFEIAPKRIQIIGIIINELLTNIMKYAFTDKKDALIEIDASLVKDKIFLKLKDNGQGIQQSKIGSGFGLVLVKELVDQLGGTIQIETNQGTSVSVTFKN